MTTQPVARHWRGLCGTLIALALTAPLHAQQKSPREIAAVAHPAVVTVGALIGGEVTAFGTGFVIREDGVIATNLHVVSSAETVRVVLASGEIYDNVYVLGRDERRDLILLQIPAKGLPTVPIGDDQTLEVGDSVYVMGNPLGLEGTFSNGLLSAKRVEDGVVHLQITAPISPGSSGGPVFDSSGAVVGVATFIYTAGQNLNVAIPARYAAGLLGVAGEATPFRDIAPELGALAHETRDKRIDTAAVKAALPADVRAQFDALEPWAQDVALGLLAIGSALDDDGWESFEDGKFALLDEGKIDSFTLHLRAGRYKVAGTCDSDCSDLDLAVAGPGDREMGKDVLNDAIPTVEFTVEKKGTYTIAARIPACATATCFYGIQLFKAR